MVLKNEKNPRRINSKKKKVFEITIDVTHDKSG